MLKTDATRSYDEGIVGVFVIVGFGQLVRGRFLLELVMSFVDIEPGCGPSLGLRRLMSACDRSI